MPKRLLDLDRSNNLKFNTPITTTFDWDFEFTRLPDVLGQDTPYTKYLKGEGCKFRLHTNNMQVPDQNLEPKSLQTYIRGFQFTQSAGDTPNYGVFGFNVQDFEDQTLQKIITSLCYASCDPETKAILDGFNPLSFRFDCNLYQLNTQRYPIKMWECRDCNIMQFDVNSDFSYQKEMHPASSIQFSCDYYKIWYNSTPGPDNDTWVDYKGKEYEKGD